MLAKARLFFAEGHGHSEGGFGLRMVRADTIFHFCDPEREEVGFEGGGAVELPGGVDQGLDKLAFGGLFGPIFVEEGLGMALVGSVILGGQDDGVAG